MGTESGSETGGRRDALVRAAFSRVAKVGFEGLRLRPVADDVGIDHSTLHHHVATRQELIVAVAEHATGQLRATMPDQPDDPVAALRGHLAVLRELFEQRPELFTVTVELDLRARRDPTVRSLMDHYENGWRDALREVLERGANLGAWAEGAHPGALAELIIAAVKGARLAPTAASKIFEQLETLLTSPGPAARKQGS